ncbi:hypothetical protein [Desulfobulbus oligotrophicus]|uniref:Uncharacterized protein n=1 Tax=Desulfobulbus oligotrophicus TaxID=1909699 RepID=A0A7T6ARB9_9BACT|nr:hypothetical protein [Desulfobulbus oligotrophicus]QQG66365.1 hypothetical protein HP555_11040 [Desulfobulbus oligotrophicus]
MGLVAAASGIQTAQVGSEHVLATNTTTGIFVLVVDTNDMAVGDSLTLRIKTMAIGGGDTRLAYTLNYADLQGEPVKYSVPVPSNNSITCTLEQTAGTARTFPWSLLRA